MKLEPLQEFVCDRCGELIKQPKGGWLEWLSGDDFKRHGFQVVHHKTYSPNEGECGCYYDSKLDSAGSHLDDFLGTDGLVTLLSMFEGSVRDPGELVEVIRRLHVPNYEEARMYWRTAKEDGYFDGDGKYSSYLQSSLRNLIDKYGQHDG
jgi:hypothetical protein